MGFGRVRTLGKFNICLDMIEDNPDKVRDLLHQVIVIRAEIDYADNAVEYVAIGDQFEEVPFGQTVPWYDILCIRTTTAVDEDEDDAGDSVGMTKVEYAFVRRPT